MTKGAELIKSKIRKGAEKSLRKGNIFKVKEISEYFGFSKSKIYRDIHNGKLKAARIRTIYRIWREDVINYIVSHAYIPKRMRG